MNDVIRTIMERRSIRRFKPEEIPHEVLREILKAGLYAPNGMGKQAVITVAVTDKETRDWLSELNRKIGGWKEGFDPFYGAPVILAVLAEKEHFTGLYDGSLVLGTMMLAAQSLGVGSIWIHRAKEEFEMEEGKALLDKLGIQGEYVGIGHCALGYPEGDLPVPAPRREGRVFYTEK